MKTLSEIKSDFAARFPSTWAAGKVEFPQPGPSVELLAQRIRNRKSRAKIKGMTQPCEQGAA